MGWYRQGINKFDRKTEKFIRYKHNHNDPNSLYNNNIYSMYKDKSGIIWISTHGGGLSRFDPDIQNFTHVKNEPGNENSLSNNSVFFLT